MDSAVFSKHTKIKLLIPIGYLGLAVGYFILSWPEYVEYHHIAGVVSTIVSFGFWIAARIQLGNAFTLAPEAMYIVRNGLYSKLRHPVYYFSILVLIGLGLYIWNLYTIIPVAALIILEVVRIRKEEAVLTQAFGKDYVDYKSKTWL